MNNDNDVIEILDDIKEDSGNMATVDNSMNAANSINTPVNNNVVEQPKSADNNLKEITIENEEDVANTKSGLPFVIVLFILLIAFIIGLPYISKLIP